MGDFTHHMAVYHPKVPLWGINYMRGSTSEMNLDNLVFIRQIILKRSYCQKNCQKTK